MHCLYATHRRCTRYRRRAAHRLALGLAAAFLAGLVPAVAAPARAQQATVVEFAGASRARGAADAPVLVFEIADFQCPYCARFWRDVFPALDSAYIQSGKVQWVFVNLPNPTLHPRAWAAAEAALCAGGTADAFWDFHDRLFERQAEWSRAADPLGIFLRYARELDVPADPFLACIHADDVAPLLVEDVVFAASSRVTGTPTFVIDRKKVVVGLKSYEEWKVLLDRALAEGGRRRRH